MGMVLKKNAYLYGRFGDADSGAESKKLISDVYNIGGEDCSLDEMAKLIASTTMSEFLI